MKTCVHAMVKGVAVLCAALSAVGVSAANRTWNGGDADDDYWSSADNWGGSVPGAGDVLYFLGDTRLSPVNDLSDGTSFAGLNFYNAISNGYSGAYTLTGNRITLGGNIDVLIPLISGWSGSITDTIALDMTLSGNRTVTTRDNLGVAHYLVFSGTVGESGGARSFTKAGGGSVWLLGANTFSGQMIINRSTVYANTITEAGTPSSLGTGSANATVRLGNNTDTGILEYVGDADASTDRPFQIGSGTVGSSGGGTIRANGAGKLTLAAPSFNVPWGATASRTLTLGGTNTDANAVLGIVSDNTGAALKLVKADGGQWVLSGTNTFSDTVVVNAGTLTVKNSSALGSTAAGTTVADKALLVLDGSDGGLDIGEESLALKGVGPANSKGALQNTAGANTYRGAITLTGDTTIGSYGGSLTLDVASGDAIGGDFNLYLRTEGGTITICDPVNIGTHTLTKAYISQVTLQSQATYGTLYILNGILQTPSLSPAAPMYLGNSANVATLRYTGAEDVTLSGDIKLGNASGSDNISTSYIQNESASNVLTLTGGITVLGSSAKDQIFRVGGSNAGSNAVTGVIADGASGQQVRVEKVGDGTWALEGNNSYSGGTTVSGGTLRVNNASGSGTGSGDVTVTNATLGGTGFIGGAVSVRAGSALAPGGTDATPGVLTCGGDLTLASGIVGSFDATATTNDSVAVAGTLTLQGPGMVALSFDGPAVPRRIPVFSFGSLSGAAYLPEWTVQGLDTNKYVSCVAQEGNSVVVVTGLRGLLFKVR